MGVSPIKTLTSQKERLGQPDSEEIGGTFPLDALYIMASFPANFLANLSPTT